VNGGEQRVKAQDLVPGDIILISEGDRVPADARLVDVKNLKVAESALSGESVPVSKKPRNYSDPECGSRRQEKHDFCIHNCNLWPWDGDCYRYRDAHRSWENCQALVRGQAAIYTSAKKSRVLAYQIRQVHHHRVWSEGVYLKWTRPALG